MAVNILEKCVAEVSDLPVKNVDGSPMLDAAGTPVTVTVFGPGTKVWQVADATRRRKAMKRTREANGKIEAALDNNDEDSIEFLCTIVKRFNNLEFPGAQGDKETVAGVFNEPKLGYIRDHLMEDTRNWENFTKASQSLSVSTSASLPG